MVVVLGVSICFICCCLWLSSSMSSSGIARHLSMRARRARLTLLPSVPLCLLLLSCLLLSVSSTALADDSDLEDLPDNYVEVSLQRTSPDEIVVVEDGTAKLKKVDNAAKSGDGDDASLPFALEVLWDLLDDSATQSAATSRIMIDLAWRYYNYPAKADKIPLKKTKNYWGLGSTVYSLQECSSYGEWIRLNRISSEDMLNERGCFKLLELNHQSRTWDTYSPAYETLYQEWYEYYEGSSSGGTQGGTYFEYLDSATTDTVVTFSNGVTRSFYNATAVSRYNDSTYPNRFSYVGGSDTSFNSGIVTYPETPEGNPDDEKYYITYVVDGDYYRFFFVSGKTSVRFKKGGSNVSTVRNSTHQQLLGLGENYYTYNFGAESINSPVYMVGNKAIGADNGGSNEPVPSPGPGPTPTVPGPTVTNVNSPTYNQNTYNNTTQTTYNVTQTDVDMQPVIDAISVVNQTGQNINASLNELDANMQEGIDGLYDMLFDWFTVLKQLIEAWYQSWAAWSEQVYNDLQYYLDQIVYVLYQILEIQQEPYVPVPEPEQVTINFDNAVDRLSTKFPFSIPWDMKMVLTMLAQPAEAPEFDFPVLMTEYTVHIDMSPLDPMADVLRFFSNIFFLTGLLMVTRKLIDF